MSMIGITIGAMADPIYKQLQKQGIKVKALDVSHFQRAHDGIVQLRVLGCMGNSECKRIEQRFVNKIGNFCKQFVNNTKPKP